MRGNGKSFLVLLVHGSCCLFLQNYHIRLHRRPVICFCFAGRAEESKLIEK